MRKAMICVSMMLAFVQLWPMIFGDRSVADVASPGARAAVVIAVPPPIKPSSAPTGDTPDRITGPSSCFVQYRARFAACAKGDLACGSAASNQWDLCEATGFWPA